MELKNLQTYKIWDPTFLTFRKFADLQNVKNSLDLHNFQNQQNLRDL